MLKPKHKFVTNGNLKRQIGSRKIECRSPPVLYESNSTLNFATVLELIHMDYPERKSSLEARLI